MNGIILLIAFGLLLVVGITCYLWGRSDGITNTSRKYNPILRIEKKIEILEQDLYATPLSDTERLEKIKMNIHIHYDIIEDLLMEAIKHI